MFILSLVTYLKDIIRSRTYENELDQYIKNRNPQTADDVDRLTREYILKQRPMI